MNTYNQEDKNIMYKTFKSRNKSRLKELVAFAKECNFRKIGIANCKAVQIYADRLKEILLEAGFDVFTINCKDSGFDGTCISDSMSGPCCDPLSQAIFLNSQQTELNINVGLCLGHGIIFAKHSNAPVTTLLVKDFETGHNIIEALK